MLSTLYQQGRAYTFTSWTFGSVVKAILIIVAYISLVWSKFCQDVQLLVKIISFRVKQSLILGRIAHVVHFPVTVHLSCFLLNWVPSVFVHLLSRGHLRSLRSSCLKFQVILNTTDITTSWDSALKTSPNGTKTNHQTSSECISSL